jgi:integrase
MKIVTRCPACRLYQNHENKVCKCGEKLKDKVYHISFRAENRLKRRKIGRNYKYAVIALGKIEESILEGKFGIKKDTHTLLTLIDWYLNLQEVRIRRRYKEIKRNLEVISKRLPNIINNGLTEAFLQDQTERAKKVGPATQNRELSYLKAMFNTAVKYTEIFYNPLAKIKLLPEDNIRNVNLSPEDVKKIIACCDPRIKEIILTAFYGLLRREEILSMKWENVDLINKVFRLSKTKNMKPRVVPIHPEVLTMLKGLPSRFEGKYVFQHIPVSTLSRLFNKACECAGLSGVHIHDARHYAANSMRLMGVSREQIKTWAGWSSDSMFSRYTFVSDDEIESIKWA